MATFRGSTPEFRRFIGPHLRNVVNQITRTHKRTIGSCEHCGSGGELHAAHVRGKTRLEIIDSILRHLTHSNSPAIEIELDAFEKLFKYEHSPVEKAILVLCQPCHRKYDSKAFDAGNASASQTVPDCQLRTHMTSDLLPITLDPPRMTDFVDLLLETKTAEIQTIFGDGNVKLQTWHANRFKRSSNLFGNLRSRPEFRQGTWQGLGITKVHVRVVARFSIKSLETVETKNLDMAKLVAIHNEIARTLGVAGEPFFKSLDAARNAIANLRPKLNRSSSTLDMPDDATDGYLPPKPHYPGELDA